MSDQIAQEALARLFDDRDRLVAAFGRERVADAPRLAVLILRYGESHIAMHATDVNFIVPRVVPTAVPGTPAHHLGLFLHKGQLWNLLAPEAALSLAATMHGGDRPAVLLRQSGVPRLALAIDEAVSVVQADRVGAGHVQPDGIGPVPLLDLSQLLPALGLPARTSRKDLPA